jgi:hypothetical protein
MDEPRIISSIAFFSCPNLLNEAYTAAQLDKQLEVVAKVLLTTKN